jgi:hypothetical protein
MVDPIVKTIFARNGNRLATGGSGATGGSNQSPN